LGQAVCRQEGTQPVDGIKPVPFGAMGHPVLGVLIPIEDDVRDVQNLRVAPSWFSVFTRCFKDQGNYEHLRCEPLVPSNSRIPNLLKACQSSGLQFS
jgi:hypothetical protein